MKKILRLDQQIDNLKLIQIGYGFAIIDVKGSIGGDTCWSNNGFFYKALDNDLGVFRSFPNQKYSETVYKLSECHRILFATENLNLEGVGLIEEDAIVAELAYKNCKTVNSNAGYTDFITGYKTGRKNMFSKEDLIEAMNLASQVTECGEPDGLEYDEIFKILEQPKVEVSFGKNNNEAIKAILI